MQVSVLECAYIMGTSPNRHRICSNGESQTDTKLTSETIHETHFTIDVACLTRALHDSFAQHDRQAFSLELSVPKGPRDSQDVTNPAIINPAPCFLHSVAL